MANDFSSVIGDLLRRSLLSTEEIYKYITGQLNDESRKVIENHLRVCSYDQERVEAIQEALKDSEGIRREDEDNTLKQNVLSEIERCLEDDVVVELAAKRREVIGYQDIELDLLGYLVIDEAAYEALEGKDRHIYLSGMIPPDLTHLCLGTARYVLRHVEGRIDLHEVVGIGVTAMEKFIDEREKDPESQLATFERHK